LPISPFLVVVSSSLGVVVLLVCRKKLEEGGGCVFDLEKSGVRIFSSLRFLRRVVFPSVLHTTVVNLTHTPASAQKRGRRRDVVIACCEISFSGAGLIKRPFLSTPARR
jgi:hypothetical protein